MIADRLLHVVARVAVRLGSVLAAKRLVDALGALLPPCTVAEAAQIADGLDPRGTCLTRALTIAARLPGSEVVLGSDGPGEHGFSAHAWVEHEGALICGAPIPRHELTRLRAR